MELDIFEIRPYRDSGCSSTEGWREFPAGNGELADERSILNPRKSIHTEVRAYH